jgi:hypothetical protein
VFLKVGGPPQISHQNVTILMACTSNAIKGKKNWGEIETAVIPKQGQTVSLPFMYKKQICN